MLKKIFATALALSMLVLAGCSNNSDANTGSGEKTPEELTTLYAEAITTNGGEMAEVNAVISDFEGDNALILEMMGLKAEDVAAVGASTSLMNVKAYGIAAVKPAEGEAEDVLEGLEGFIARKQADFEFYLEDQYEVALAARLETLEDGTILMVMTEDQDQVFDGISAAILGK